MTWDGSPDTKISLSKLADSIFVFIKATWKGLVVANPGFPMGIILFENCIK